MNPETLAARAAAGAAMLDERAPGWALRVNPETLAMHDKCGCVLGQLGGHYDDERSRLGLSPDEADALGFNLFGCGKAGWTWLEAAWAGEIRARREQAQVTR